MTDSDQHVTSRQFRSALDEVQLDYRLLARLLGVHHTTAWRWCRNEGPPQYAVAFLVAFRRVSKRHRLTLMRALEA